MLIIFDQQENAFFFMLSIFLYLIRYKLPLFIQGISKANALYEFLN